jgi:hypothetical protein
MSHPQFHSGEISPFQQSKTLFVVESHEAALLVTFTKGKHKSKAMKFETAHAALDWCIKNKAGMVFTLRTDPSQN